MEGKDATLSATNLAIATLVSTMLMTNGIALDPQTVLTIGAGLVGLWGRWRVGGIGSVAGLSIPQPKVDP